MSDHHTCRVCGNRIHRSRVPNSITGDVMCCGQRMSAPGDVVTAVLTLVGLGLIAGGTYLLRVRAEWGWLASIGASGLATLALLFFVGPPIAALVDRMSKKDGRNRQ